jgi:hypothetical protein
MTSAKKNYLIKTSCRQCQSSVSTDTKSCPLCGLARPVIEKLNPLEKEYLNSTPMVPAKFQDMCNTVNPRLNLAQNMLSEARDYINTPEHSYLFIISFLAIFFGGGMLLGQVLFPLSFMLFWAGLVYVGFDSINFMRALTITFLVKRLQLKTGLAPYPVLFKLESQIDQILESLQLLVNSFFVRDWNKSSDEFQASSENFLTAARVLTARLKNHASISLETASIIWRNNVYSIVAMNTSFQEKAVAIGNKIREAEALVLRYRWLVNLEKINVVLEDFISKGLPENETNAQVFAQTIIEKFNLSQYGAISEEFVGDFQHVPFDLPFKCRYYWHQQLPPFPLKQDEFLEELDTPAIRELFESINQVSALKAKLEEQMVLTTASKALANAASIDQNTPATLEAQELLRFQLYAKYLDIPKFQPESEQVQKAVDKLSADARVALGNDNGNLIQGLDKE